MPEQPSYTRVPVRGEPPVRRETRRPAVGGRLLPVLALVAVMAGVFTAITFPAAAAPTLAPLAPGAPPPDSGSATGTAPAASTEEPTADPAAVTEERDATEPRKDAHRVKIEEALRQSLQVSSSGLRGDGSPAPGSPGYVEGGGPSEVTGVPNFVIRKFRVPLFLLPIYQAAGIEYGIPWEVLAAINEIETDYGRNLNVSSAGALGWMQFMPSSWKAYGVDKNEDGKKDPYNPVDAIFAAARYLKAAGAADDLRRAVFAYNHADWYVDSVMLRARLIGGVPADVVGSLTGLTEGRFPVYARARYADDLSQRDASKRVRRGANAARVVADQEGRRGIEIYSRKRAPVVATNDGVIKRIGNSPRLGRYVVLQDVYGNRYMYAGLDSVARSYPVPKERSRDLVPKARALPANDPKPDQPASAGRQSQRSKDAPRGQGRRQAAARPQPKVALKARLFANAKGTDTAAGDGLDRLMSIKSLGRSVSFRKYFARPFGLNSKDVKLKRFRRGAHVIGGTIIGRVGKFKKSKAPHLYFEIRPAGRGTPRIDPKPILDGWRLLESTAIYRASGRNALLDGDKDSFSIGQVLLLPKSLLERRVLADERIKIYGCGRDDIRAGQIDRRVLATLAYLAESRLRPTVTSLRCGHSVFTASGNVSHHSSGNAVDITAINDEPILGNQGEGEITAQTVKDLLRLQGTIQPAQIISLLDMGGPSFAMADHADHIHVGFRPLFGTNRRLGKETRAVLDPDQWDRLIERLGEIDNPVVSRKPSKYAIPVRKSKRASTAHQGE